MAGWLARNQVLGCGDAVALTRLRCFDLGVAGPGRAVAVERHVISPLRPLVSDFSCGQDGFWTSEGTANEGDAVVGIFL